MSVLLPSSLIGTALVERGSAGCWALTPAGLSPLCAPTSAARGGLSRCYWETSVGEELDWRARVALAALLAPSCWGEQGGW